MSEEDKLPAEKMKSKDLVWLLKEDRTPSNSSTTAAQKSGKITPEQHRGWKVLERGKSEVQNPKAEQEGKKEVDPKLQRSTSFPVKPVDSSNRKDRLELCYPVHEAEEEEFSPVLYRSKSSLWSVSTDSSAVTAHHKTTDNRQSEISASNSKLNAAVALRNDPERSLQSPLATADRGSNRDLSTNEPPRSTTPQPPKPQRTFFKMQSNESVMSQPKRTQQGLPVSVQEFKSKSDRDPVLANEELKVSFQDIIVEPIGYNTPRFSWSLSKEIYEFSKGCCYTVVSCLCALPFALFWGIWFSILACLNVWCLTPFKRSHIISIAYWKAIWSLFVSCFCDPVYQSAGMILGNIHIRTEKHIV